MRRYGTDKPDLRFGLEIQDLTELLQAADFRIFQADAGPAAHPRDPGPGAARALAPELDELQEVAEAGGAPARSG
jgi:aspartyl-tRNA synthetase